MTENKPVDGDSGDANNGESEVTVREGTLFSLRKSQEEFDAIKVLFQTISDKFDSGEDGEGLALIKDDVIPKLSHLYEFCFTLGNVFTDVIGEKLEKQLTSTLNSMDTLMKTLGEETGKGNFTEVGDLLRFDYFDLINELSELFKTLCVCFETSKNTKLDKY